MNRIFSEVISDASAYPCLAVELVGEDGLGLEVEFPFLREGDRHVEADTLDGAGLVDGGAGAESIGITDADVGGEIDLVLDDRILGGGQPFAEGADGVGDIGLGVERCGVVSPERSETPF